MKILWVGDAVTQTGFARVTHNVCGRLHAKGHEIHVLGINHNGDPHDYPYKIYPAILGGDMFGLGRLKAMIQNLQPDVVVINNDPWIVRDYLTEVPLETCVVAYMPVDALNQDAAKELNGLARAVAYTQFGRRELALGGLTIQCDVIPHGVDTSIYSPRNRMDGRKKLNFKKTVDLEDAFIAMNVNRNQPRKRLDLAMEYWTAWWIEAGQPRNAFLYFHCSNREPNGWDVIRAAKYYGIEEQFCLTSAKMTPQQCLPESEMATLYSMADVMFTTTLGEGWGLPHHEAMACGVPQIMPRYSALAEWPKGGVHYVDVTSHAMTPLRINTVGGVADKAQMIQALNRFWEDKDYRKQMADAGRALAIQPKYTWDAVADQFHVCLLEAIVANSRRVADIKEAMKHGQVPQEPLVV
jgi:glycosyltransferase involved in cell wall biosynthesis